MKFTAIILAMASAVAAVNEASVAQDARVGLDAQYAHDAQAALDFQAALDAQAAHDARVAHNAKIATDASFGFNGQAAGRLQNAQAASRAQNAQAAGRAQNAQAAINAQNAQAASNAQNAQGSQLGIEANAGMQWDIDQLLTGLGPMVQRSQCIVPCAYKVVNSLNCAGRGPIDTICNSMNIIAQRTTPCAQMCGLDNGFKDTILRIAGGICTRQPGATIGGLMPAFI
ncbi:histidine-rich protein PFHRP-II-like isoform X2 [Ophiocordyceps camponoti-floridani]|uniref:Histidine-rich protein PFHRP-II-like isoform X2 n=1 Tax=Ophiocordyceps camponoti-floridani TaxID=2030778 RepID=A0A8H4VFB2_9HYPO|nr:histidine-rich protein PFHRP-II-like isoform X2 [Ophiocordyceps camponoti-floridani]